MTKRKGRRSHRKVVTDEDVFVTLDEPQAHDHSGRMTVLKAQPQSGLVLALGVMGVDGDDTP
jgi:hypothetical protein